MSVTARVDHYSVENTVSFLYESDYFAFRIALRHGNAHAAARGVSFYGFHERLIIAFAVKLGFAYAQHIEICAVDNENFHAHERYSSNSVIGIFSVRQPPIFPITTRLI